MFEINLLTSKTLLSTEIRIVYNENKTTLVQYAAYFKSLSNHPISAFILSESA